MNKLSLIQIIHNIYYYFYKYITIKNNVTPVNYQPQYFHDDNILTEKISKYSYVEAAEEIYNESKVKMKRTVLISVFILLCDLIVTSIDYYSLIFHCVFISFILIANTYSLRELYLTRKNYLRAKNDVQDAQDNWNSLWEELNSKILKRTVNTSVLKYPWWFFKEDITNDKITNFWKEYERLKYLHTDTMNGTDLLFETDKLVKLLKSIEIIDNNMKNHLDDSVIRDSRRFLSLSEKVDSHDENFYREEKRILMKNNIVSKLNV